MNPRIGQGSSRTGRRKGSRAGSVIIVVLLVAAAVILAQVRFDLPVETLAGEFAGDHSRFAEVDGLNVHYRDEGAGEPLILLHGWSASLHTWEGWAEELKGDFRVIRLDLPAFGLTGPAEGADYSLDFYADFLDHFLEALGVESCSIAGNSLGGGIAWLYAAQHPEEVRKVILVDAAGYSMKMPAITRLARPQFVRAIIRHITPRYAIRFLVNQVYGDRRNVTAATVNRYYRLLLREGNREVLFQVLDKIPERDDQAVARLLGGLPMPVLIMWGQKDAWIPPELGRRFERDIPNARLITYEGAGHIPMEEIPEKTVRDARDFLLEE